MNSQILHIGEENQPILIIDDYATAPESLVELTPRLQFSAVEANLYPGVRAVIEPVSGTPGHTYVDSLCRDILPLVQQTFGVRGFEVREAAFSLITAKPETLQVRQRLPHFDTTSSGTLAVLHYLCHNGGGTGFYRHRTTRFETVTQERHLLYEEALALDLCLFPVPESYFRDAGEMFESIHTIEACFNRLVVYRGNALHSALLPPGFNLSSNPRIGRLTANVVLGAA